MAANPSCDLSIKRVLIRFSGGVVREPDVFEPTVPTGDLTQSSPLTLRLGGQCELLIVGRCIYAVRGECHMPIAAPPTDIPGHALLKQCIADECQAGFLHR